MVQTIYDVIPVVMPNRSGHPWIVRVQNELERQRVKRRYGSGDHAISISLLTKNDMVEHLGIPADRISVVHLGVNMADFSAATDPTERQRLMGEHQLPEKWFICVSSDHYRKNHQRLFDAWCQVAAQVPEGLVFVGRPLYESTLQKIDSEVRERGLQARFRWIRNLSDEKLPALYRQATAAVAPSLYEGFGMTVLEAMACGAPVLAARNGAYEEVGSDAAEYFDPRSVEDIAAQLTWLSGDEPLRATMRQRGLLRAAQKTWTQMARETVAVYRKLLGLPQT